MCDGLGQPASVTQALAMLDRALDHLNATDTASLPASVQAKALRTLERAGAKQVAARTRVLAAFAGQAAYEGDGHGSARAWLRWQTRVTTGAAAGAVGWLRRLDAHPVIGDALAAGDLSESWARQVCAWTDRLPPARQDDADEILAAAARAGADLAGLGGLAQEMYERAYRDHDDAPPDGFGERAVWLGTTMGGAGRLTGDLTPACSAALAAVLEALGKRAGPEDIRSAAQRRHDALAEACRRLIASGMLPDRAGQPTQVQLHMTLSQLRDQRGASAAEAAWAAARASQPGWVAGPEAEAAACDATVVPIVTGYVDWAALDRLTDFYLATRGLRPDGSAGPAHGASATEGTSERTFPTDRIQQGPAADAPPADQQDGPGSSAEPPRDADGSGATSGTSATGTTNRTGPPPDPPTAGQRGRPGGPATPPREPDERSATSGTSATGTTNRTGPPAGPPTADQQGRPGASAGPPRTAATSGTSGTGATTRAGPPAGPPTADQQGRPGGSAGPPRTAGISGTSGTGATTRAGPPAGPPTADQQGIPGGPCGCACGGCTCPARPPLSPATLARLRQTMLRLAADVMSGPAGLAAWLRNSEFAGVSGGAQGGVSHGAATIGASASLPLAVPLPLDIGDAEPAIPAHLRRAVLARHQHCTYPGCRVPAAFCQIHHYIPRSRGGPTSLDNLGPACVFHHQIAVHRWGWTLTLHPDGEVTATSPDGRRVLRDHDPPSQAA